MNRIQIMGVSIIAVGLLATGIILMVHPGKTKLGSGDNNGGDEDDGSGKKSGGGGGDNGSGKKSGGGVGGATAIHASTREVKQTALPGLNSTMISAAPYSRELIHIIHG